MSLSSLVLHISFLPLYWHNNFWIRELIQMKQNHQEEISWLLDWASKAATQLKSNIEAGM